MPSLLCGPPDPLQSPKMNGQHRPSAERSFRGKKKHEIRIGWSPTSGKRKILGHPGVFPRLFLKCNLLEKRRRRAQNLMSQTWPGSPRHSFTRRRRPAYWNEISENFSSKFVPKFPMLCWQVEKVFRPDFPRVCPSEIANRTNVMRKKSQGDFCRHGNPKTWETPGDAIFETPKERTSGGCSQSHSKSPSGEGYSILFCPCTSLQRGSSIPLVQAVIGICKCPTLDKDENLVSVSVIPSALAAPATPHYEKPPCQSHETAAGSVTSEACFAKCDSTGSCPTDVVSGVTAKPQCAIKDQSGK